MCAPEPSLVAVSLRAQLQEKLSQQEDVLQSSIARVQEAQQDVRKVQGSLSEELTAKHRELQVRYNAAAIAINPFPCYTGTHSCTRCQGMQQSVVWLGALMPLQGPNGPRTRINEYNNKVERYKKEYEQITNKLESKGWKAEVRLSVSVAVSTRQLLGIRCDSLHDVVLWCYASMVCSYGSTVCVRSFLLPRS